MKRHAFDPISFVSGLAFLFLAVFVLTGNTLADLWPTWALTLPAMAVGLLILLYAVRRVLPTSTERSGDVAAVDDDATDA